MVKRRGMAAELHAPIQPHQTGMLDVGDDQ